MKLPKFQVLYANIPHEHYINDTKVGMIEQVSSRRSVKSNAWYMGANRMYDAVVALLSKETTDSAEAATDNTLQTAIELMDALCLRMELQFERDHYDVNAVNEYRNAKDFVIAQRAVVQ